MRVLVATTAGAGHFAAIVPFAAAIRDAGHIVRVAAPESFASKVQRAGFDHTPLPDPPPDELGAIFARLSSLSMEEANSVVIREVFCGSDARAALPGMREAVQRWRPNVILRETAEYSSYLAAELNGIPYVNAAISLESVERHMQSMVDEPLRALGSKRGAAGLMSAPRLTLVPPSLEEPVQLPSHATYRFGAARTAIPEADFPSEWWPDTRAPLVYVTFGSVAAGIGFFPDFYRAVLNALAPLPVRVLMTLGEAGDLERLGTLPQNVHVERWWPQEEVMQHTSVMVTHGGFGTTLLGLSAGIPMLVIPLFALDQYANARRVQAIGAGIDLKDGAAALPRIGESLEQILSDGAYRAEARRVADEIAHLPDPSECVAAIEAIAATKL